MNILFPALAKEPILSDIYEYFGQKDGQNYIYGVSGSQKHAIVAACYKMTRKRR